MFIGTILFAHRKQCIVRLNCSNKDTNSGLCHVLQQIPFRSFRVAMTQLAKVIFTSFFSVHVVLNFFESHYLLLENGDYLQEEGLSLFVYRIGLSSLVVTWTASHLILSLCFIDRMFINPVKGAFCLQCSLNLVPTDLVVSVGILQLTSSYLSTKRTKRLYQA